MILFGGKGRQLSRARARARAHAREIKTDENDRVVGVVVSSWSSRENKLSLSCLSHKEHAQFLALKKKKKKKT